MTPKSLYSTVAVGETITWALLLTGMVLKYSGTTEAFMPIAGGIHGFVFLCFCVSTVVIWVNNQWPAGRGVLGLVSAIVPFATIPFEKSAEKAGLLDAQWRFREGDESQPGNLPEKILAFVVRQPLLASIIALVAVIIVFLILLSLGSPLEWFK